jgi:hypothetical protein
MDISITSILLIRTLRVKSFSRSFGQGMTGLETKPSGSFEHSRQPLERKNKVGKFKIGDTGLESSFGNCSLLLWL